MSLGKELGHLPDTRTYKAWGGFLLPDTRIGVEFEFEGVRSHALPNEPWAKLWELHEERSIRDGGAEYAFVGPMFGQDAHTAITGLVANAVVQRWRASRRTGIHVHLDARDLSIPQMIGVSLLYALFEPAIYRWIGDNRDSNVFCLPWYKAEGAIDDVSGVLTGALYDQSQPGSERTRRAAQIANRYAGLNLHSLFEHGSMEFRQMRTTTDLARIMNWINLIMALKQGAIRAPTCDGVLLGLLEREAPRSLCRDFLGETALELLDYPEFDEEVLNIGLPTANQLVLESLTPPTWSRAAPPPGVHPGFARFMETQINPLAVAPATHFVPPPERRGDQVRVRVPNPYMPRGTRFPTEIVEESPQGALDRMIRMARDLAEERASHRRLFGEAQQTTPVSTTYFEPADGPPPPRDPVPGWVYNSLTGATRRPAPGQPLAVEDRVFSEDGVELPRDQFGVTRTVTVTTTTSED